MPITDPEAVAFSEEYTRVAAQFLADFKAFGESMKANWDGGASTQFTANPTETISDQNGARHPYLGSDATNVMTRVNDILAILQAANAMDSVNKGAVRAPSFGG